MSTNKITPEQLQVLIQYASQRLNTTPQELAKTIQSGGVDALTSRLSPSDAAKLQSIGDRQKLEQLLNSPQAQALIQSLTK